ncbi:MAG: hypothetical protein K8S97_06775 [Anaerolineae bacterium]|nr:hypothetical protein [Anaerolineae bacterium]
MTERHVRSSRGGLSWFALIVGIGIGIAAGLFYTWNIDPVVERNTAPRQLSAAAKEDYIVAVALSYAHNGDLALAFDRLRKVSPEQDVWVTVAEVSCQRVNTGKAVTNNDILVLRALGQLYIPQGASGCAELYPTPAPAMVFASPIPSQTPTATVAPPPTKTATPPAGDTGAQPVRPTATPVPSDSFIVTRTRSFCDPDASGVIEVRVYDRQGAGIPGVPVTISATGIASDRFFTGLKPERGAEYADFKMEPGRTYTVTMLGLIDAPPIVEAVQCQTTLDDGTTVTTTMSYWVNFQQRGE